MENGWKGGHRVYQMQWVREEEEFKTEMDLELRAEVQDGKENLILYFLLAPSLLSARLPASSLIHSLYFLTSSAQPSVLRPLSLPLPCSVSGKGHSRPFMISQVRAFDPCLA